MRRPLVPFLPALLLLALSCLAGPALAHEVRPAYLELKQTGAETYDVLWKVPAAGGDRRLALFVRFPDGTEETSEHRGRFAGGAFVDRWSVRHPGGLAGRSLTIDGLRGTRVDVLVRLERLDGTTLVSRVQPAQPGLLLTDAPGLPAVAGTYLALGVEHILLGPDHLLFVLALLLIARGRRRLLLAVTAFTVAHSITLALAALGFVHVPAAPVEAVIALSIVFLACEIVHGRGGQPGLTERRPWVVAFVFGLLHGLGFAGALAEVGLPGHAIPVSLLFFNVGVELGQVLFVAAALALAPLLRRLAAWRPERAGLVPAYGIGSVAACWTIERVAAFWA
jgi:hydrogenase/urease accessory protein HupE